MADRVQSGADDDSDIPPAVSGTPLRNSGPRPDVILHSDISKATVIRPANTPSPPMRGIASRWIRRRSPGRSISPR